MTTTKDQGKAGWKKAAARVNAGRGFTEQDEPAELPAPTSSVAKSWKAVADRCNSARQFQS